MKFNLNRCRLLSVSMIIVSMLSLSACSSATVKAPVSIPEDALGVVFIDSPTVGSLLYLRGIAGKGELIRKESHDLCYRSALRIAAGDFNGEGISIKDANTIVLAVYDPKAIKRLKEGDEIVSEDYDISVSGEPHGDIEIISGLSLSQGFVLNPGEWSLSFLFGINEERISC
ncbi:hypothetical protein [Marinomonas mediterranea]|uniref:Lipoprotein n=1 Tax=Marinomonas mediterranea (strain ATCC 700492 / JCM 21426 / NBRC 103028 / MMB-1) TaxID=717774 RepID=F2JYR4_MARM1|nr:hypothetical protein [Marinomonas mediterranea]ADZ89689.1 hypothetical protein Marme_0389 [Marinomonas mediterranea MMB-1]WCN15923.1 hypothetical protein GV053_01965 [Marinomonas mediterranea MMB-1]